MSIRPLPALTTLLLLSATSVASNAFASGSIPPSNNRDYADQFQRNQVNDAYQQGQVLYLERIACGRCPLPGGVANADAARDLIARLKDGEFDLRRSERNDIRRFVERRWDLR